MNKHLQLIILDYAIEFIQCDKTHLIINILTKFPYPSFALN